MHHYFSSKIIYELKNTIEIKYVFYRNKKYINLYLACIAIFLQFNVKFIEHTAYMFSQGSISLFTSKKLFMLFFYITFYTM